MGVKTYSRKADGAKALTPNLKVEEFACRDGSDVILISEELVTLLQKIRDHFGRSMEICSGYRTEAYNKKIGGAAKSQHMLGMAADIAIAGITPLAVASTRNFCSPPPAGSASTPHLPMWMYVPAGHAGITVPARPSLWRAGAAMRKAARRIRPWSGSQRQVSLRETETETSCWTNP